MKSLYKTSTLIRVLVSSILLASFQLVNAQDSDNSSTNTDIFNMSLEDLLNTEIVSASKRSEKASEAPATVHVISNQQIQTRGYSYLEDVLMDIPEIEIHQQTNTQTDNQATIRGIVGNAKFLIMLDGHRINSPASSKYPLKANFSIANAERIEVIIGPASALYGVSAFSGIINIISKKSPEGINASLTSSYGNYNTTDNSISVGASNGDVNFNLNGSFYNSDNADLYSIYKDAFEWYNETYTQSGEMNHFTGIIETGTPKAFNRASSGHTLHASLNYKNFYLGYFGNSEKHSSATGMSPEVNLYIEESFMKHSQNTIYSGYEHSLMDNRLTLTTQLQYSTFKLDPESKFTNIYTKYNDGFKYAMEESFFFTQQATFNINENSNLIGGVQYQSINSIPKSSDLPRPYNEQLPAPSQNIEYIGTDVIDESGHDLTIYQDFYQIRYENIGAYVQYQVSAFDNIVRFTLGTRYDHNTRYGDSFNPRLGIVAVPTEKLTLKALFGTAFLEPSPYVTYQHYGSFYSTNNEGQIRLAGGLWHLPNPDLKPERLETFEFSGSYQLNNNWNISGNGFYNQMHELIGNVVYTEDQHFHNIPISKLETPENKGKASTFGGTVRVNMAQRLGLNSKLQANVAYTYMDGILNDAPITMISNQFVKSNFDFYYKKFSVGLAAKYRFARDFEREVENEETKEVTTEIENSAEYLLINLNVRYQAIDNKTIGLATFVKVNNLLNQKYYGLYNPDFHGSFGYFDRAPQEPIRFRVGVQCTFK